MRALRGSNAAAVIAALTPIIQGWAAYYRAVVSSKIFGDLDNYVWKLTYRWAKRTHGGKSKRWVVRRYFGAVQQVQERQLGVQEPRRRRRTRQRPRIWSSSPGLLSSGTRWSPERRLPTIPI
jgi:hypothetical protein